MKKEHDGAETRSGQTLPDGGRAAVSGRRFCPKVSTRSRTICLRRRSAPLRQRFDHHGTLPVQHAHTDRFATAPHQCEVDRAGPHAQVPQDDLVDKLRKVRPPESDFACTCVEFHAQHRGEQRERGCARLRLRRARHRVEGRPTLWLTMQPAEELRQTAQIHVRGRFE
jgi:hypothetical protein